VVTEEREPGRPPYEVYEDSLFEFLKNEPDLSSVSDLKVRYK